MPRRKAEEKPDQQALSFEQALEQLEGIVEAMENEQLPLEELVACYEKGSGLLTHCQSVLDSAKRRIELITLRSRGDSGLENPAAAGDPSYANPPSAEPDGTDDDDIRLF
ncbi:MAG TPA: exodeoxyribonuclease VII small subunit [Luteolibacter sp.]|nr:exodeoxyribonuclease VII small subunit [Luteolibacter sp.]